MTAIPAGSGLRSVGRKVLLHEAVQDEIKRFIATGGLRPGSPLPSEGEFAAELGVGRNSVREAVKALESMGILDVRAGSGLFVKELDFNPVTNYLAYASLRDFQSLADVRDVRRYLEYGLVELVVERFDPEQLQLLQAVVDEWEGVARKGIYSPAMDRQFHEAMLARVDNPILASILDTFWTVQAEATARGSLAPVADTVVHFQQHVAILDALQTGNPGELRQAIMDHFGHIWARSMVQSQST